MPKKTLTTSLDNDLQKEIKKLAIDLERPLNDLLEESIKDLLKKYSSKKKK
jgi:predicted transcriptional regulator